MSMGQRRWKRKGLTAQNQVTDWVCGRDCEGTTPLLAKAMCQTAHRHCDLDCKARGLKLFEPVERFLCYRC
jgi:hypothetical protein